MPIREIYDWMSRAGNRSVYLGSRQLNRRATESKVNRLPGQQQSRSTPPGVCPRGRLHRARDRRDQRLGKKLAWHVVARCAICQNGGVQARQVGGSHQAHPGFLGRDPRHRGPYRRIVVEGVLDGLSQRQRRRRLLLGGRGHRTHAYEIEDENYFHQWLAIPKHFTDPRLR